jgi:hypothetical protein
MRFPERRINLYYITWRHIQEGLLLLSGTSMFIYMTRFGQPLFEERNRNNRVILSYPFGSIFIIVYGSMFCMLLSIFLNYLLLLLCLCLLIIIFMYFYCYVWSVLCILSQCVVLCIVCVSMCTVLLPPGVNPIAVNKMSYYIILNVMTLERSCCKRWAWYLNRYSDWLQAGRFGDRIPVRTRFFAPVQTGPGAHPASCKMDTGSFPGVESGRGVTLTPHPF